MGTDHLELKVSCLRCVSHPEVTESCLPWWSPASPVFNQSDRILINMLWSRITQDLLGASKQMRDLLKINEVTIWTPNCLLRGWRLLKITAIRLQCGLWRMNEWKETVQKRLERTKLGATITNPNERQSFVYDTDHAGRDREVTDIPQNKQDWYLDHFVFN